MDKIYRLYIEKKAGFDVEAANLFNDLRQLLELKNLLGLRILYRYDVQGLGEEEYILARDTVFSDPPQDKVYEDLFPTKKKDYIFGVEYLPGQYDQRSDSAAQCIQILTHKTQPPIRSAKIFILSGELDDQQVERVKKFCINPVDSRIASMEKPNNLALKIAQPESVKTIEGFISCDDGQLREMISAFGLAMSFADLEHCQDYFKNEEKRNPTITEIKLLDTYWSDHCRHTTFHTKINSVKINLSDYSDLINQTHLDYFESRKYVYADTPRENCLMDLATIAMKELRKRGGLKELDLSEEINACSIKIPVDVGGKTEDWLIMFKNETHNHPTEIEPYGGAATCLGGAIRDPLSGRAYVYQAMRVTGSGDPRRPLKETLPGKLPQRTITTTAAKGYSSYGNQIGLATGLVSEIYHEGYVAKRMEVGAVIAAVPAENVCRVLPEPGDIVLLIGGRTGRDGVGGATGSSKAHTESALKNEAEVQKGNPPIERKLQRWFTNKAVSKKIKRCNDFGAGGVSVAIGELTESLDIFLDKVPKKYEGLDGTELALSESQERMAVVIAPEYEKFFLESALAENLEATHVATVTDSGRLKMFWQGQTIVDLQRTFLDTNGIQQEADVEIGAVSRLTYFSKNDPPFEPNLKAAFLKNLAQINVVSQQGLVEQFDGTIGARSVLHPHGGKFLNTPIESMVSKLPFIESDTSTVMSWGFDPELSQMSPYHGAVYAVVESVAKIVTTGGDYQKIYLTFQEYFEKLGNDPLKWGKPYAALLGAFHAQMAFGIAAIGGKDSMSGTFNTIHVPPTLISFAVAPTTASITISPEFKSAGHTIILVKCIRDKNDMPDFNKLKVAYTLVNSLAKERKIYASSTIKMGGIAAAISKMAFGNKIGFRFDKGFLAENLFNPNIGALICEVEKSSLSSFTEGGIEFEVIGETINEPVIIFGEFLISIEEALSAWRKTLETVFPTEHTDLPLTQNATAMKNKGTYIKKGIVPQVFIPIFPGTNCEYDSEQAFKKVGARVSSLVFNNLNSMRLDESIRNYAAAIKQAQIIMIPGGFSAGDEPEGSGKFIASVFRNPAIVDAVMDLLKNRDGLILGICNGFQALVKLGLLPFGEIRNKMSEESPTLTFNKLKRHYSTMVRTKIVSGLSPWLHHVDVGDEHILPISNGEGRFVANEKIINDLFQRGQVATQYVDITGSPSMESTYNPSGAMYAIEGITSLDGRIFGKMAHSERIGIDIARNIPGAKDQMIFKAGVAYFS